MLLEWLLRVGLLLVGTVIVVWTILSITRMLILPRSDNVPMTRFVFKWVYRAFYWSYLNWVNTYQARDRLLSFWAPITLLILPMLWLFLIMVGHTFVYLAVSETLNLREALVLSGSSLMTLGFKFTDEIPVIIIAFGEAAMGMMFIALLIGYLPTMYSAFSQRERAITRLEYYAGNPLSAIEMIRRLEFVGKLYSEEQLADFWEEWEGWFAQLEESHTTLAPMNFFRSPKPGRSWLTASGTVLDCAALIASSVNVTMPRSAGVMIRSGFTALRAIADFFRMPYDPDPNPTDPISISRAEFDAAYDELLVMGIDLKPDRDQCWRDFTGWRVNYDAVIRRLAAVTYAPYCRWVSDHLLNPDGTEKHKIQVTVKDKEVKAARSANLESSD